MSDSMGRHGGTSQPVQPAGPARSPLGDRDPATVLEELPQRIQACREEVEKVVVGQSVTVSAVLYALLVRGHCLLVGVPGLAKTLLVRALSRVTELSFSRIQFTPDLMPADITGTVILQVDPETQNREFVFARGPVFAHMILADEINRTPPKTQAALLEAMQEKTVTVAGETHRLEEPFVVLATQNPIEQEGTYPLPEAQLDRFLFEITVTYPSIEEERRIVAEHSYTPLEQLRPVLSRADILAFREAVLHIPAPPNVVDYAVRLARATRPGDPSAPEYIKEWVHWGASPRASQYLILAGRARAACQGRFNVATEDVAAVALPVLRHRLVRTFRAEADQQSTDDIVRHLLGDVPQDTGG
jgi:MoxR-like ATPase